MLVTGGAGFIGSHVVDQLLSRNYEVVVYDSLVEQVHGATDLPRHLDPNAEFVRADVRDSEKLDHCLARVDGVIHLAAEVGVGQSMYEISKYISANVSATASLLQLITDKHRDLEKLVVASSMSIYGEGLYRGQRDQAVAPGLRTRRQLAEKRWEHETDGMVLSPAPTPETKRLAPSSVYAISKMDQELYTLNVADAYSIPASAVRYFNAYGPRQSLSNPYTGVAAIFGGRLLNGKHPTINEDGKQIRDFVHVEDVAAGTILALESPQSTNNAFNIGSGHPISIRQVADTLRNLIDPQLSEATKPEVTEKYRIGDIRHCYADVRKAAELLRYAPKRKFLEDGAEELAAWIARETADDNIQIAAAELDKRGLRV